MSAPTRPHTTTFTSVQPVGATDLPASAPPVKPVPPPRPVDPVDPLQAPMPPLPQRVPTAPTSNDVLTAGGQRASGGQDHGSDGLLLPLVTLVAIHDLPAAAPTVRAGTSSAGVVVSGADDAIIRPD
ncbi:MAG TPA: hypothetical protein VGN28_13450 [Blastococcus sp.]|jgi:hypothetical protein|nr:hypothetical protein [Blastococcus sp.]